MQLRLEERVGDLRSKHPWTRQSAQPVFDPEIIAQQSTSSYSYKSGARWIHLELLGNVETHLLLHPVTHNNHFGDDR